MCKYFLELLMISGLIIFSTSCSQPSPSPETAHPHHLVIMVFDAMRPDFIDRFDLKNFKTFRSESRNYQNAYLGYLGAETVVSHLVIPTGLPPKDLPWHDDVYFDQEGKLNSEAKGAYYNTGSLSFDEMTKLMKTLPPNSFLPFEMKDQWKGGQVFAIGEKNYATMALGGPYADSIITMKKKKVIDASGGGKICVPDGVNVPSYLSNRSRFTVECQNAYGTEKTYYPLDGSRMVPGQSGLGGDVWVADAAFEVMKHEKWSALFLTFGGTDKVMHMLGEADGPRPTKTRNIKTSYSLEVAAQIADAQLGRVIQKLKDDRLWEETVVVVTADHGAQTDSLYLGNGDSSRFGVLKNDSVSDVSKTVKQYSRLADVGFTLQDTAIRVWMKKPGMQSIPVRKALSKIKGVTEVYEKVSLSHQEGAFLYYRVFKTKHHESETYWKWSNQHAEEILNATAASDSPDLIALLADHTGFDLLGDHGGAQESVQRIPLMMRIPGENPHSVSDSIRLYELKGKIEAALGIVSKF